MHPRQPRVALLSTQISVARTRQRYETAAENARRETALRLGRVVGVDFNLGRWGAKAREAYPIQWGDQSHFNWPEVFRRHNEMDRLDIVMWGPGDRLSGLAMGLTTSVCVKICFLEGDPRPDCPLKKHRTLIAIECSACYAQGLGRDELRIFPVNKELEEYYRSFGFEPVKPPKGEQPYWRRKV